MLTLLTTTGVAAAIDNVARALGPLLLGQDYVITATASCWIQQGTNRRITCVAKAGLGAGDRITVGVAPEGTKVYEFDLGGGVTPGTIPVNVSADTTAAQVAAGLATAIAAHQPSLTLTVNGDGTLDVRALDTVVTIVPAAANPGFAVTELVMPVAAGNGSTLVSPGAFSLVVNGDQGAQIGVIQEATATGRACLVRCLRS